MSSHRFADHVGEVELVLEAGSDAGLLDEALAAFRELVDTPEGPRAPARHEVEVSAADVASLLAAWIDELVYLAEVHDFVPERAIVLELSDGWLRATLDGVRAHPRHLVKGATLHDLRVDREGEIRHARLVLDV